MGAGLERLSDARLSGAGTPLDGQMYIYNATTGKYQPTTNPSTPTNLLPLQRARMALATADTTPCHWLAIGDSVTEGTGTTSAYRDNRYINRLLRMLQRRHTTAGIGGPGYVGLNSFPSVGATQGSAAWSLSSGSIANSTEDQMLITSGSGGNDVTQTLTMTAATSIDLYSAGQSPYPTSIKYTVDGGTQQTLTFAARPSGYIANGIYKVGSITLGASGAHTVVFAPPTAGTTNYVAGAVVYNGDEGTGIRLWPGGHFATTSTAYLVGLPAVGSAANTAKIAANLQITPALVTILLGFNDYSTGVDPATFQSNLTSIIANCKSAWPVTPSFLLMTPYQRGDVTSPTYPWSQYIAACNAVAAADPTNVASLSFTDRITSAPVVGNSYARGLVNTDMVHPTTGGHFYLAEALDALLAPA